MDLDIYNYKSYKHLSQEIYNILYYNNEKYTVTNSYILCSYSKLSIKSKDAINKLLTDTVQIMILLIIIPSVVSIVNLVIIISIHILNSIYYKYLTD